MSASRLDLLLHGCQQDHVPEYITSAERQARLERLRASAMSDWEGALMFGEGNYLTRVYAPMLVGLIDVAQGAEQLLEHPGSEQAREFTKRAITKYLHDLDTSKAAQSSERAYREQAEADARAQALAQADARALSEGKS